MLSIANKTNRVKAGVLTTICLLMPLLHSCAPMSGEVQSKRLATARTYVFTCDDGYDFVARIEDETAWLFLSTGTLAAQQTADGSYRSADVVFRVKDQGAQLKNPTGKFLTCRNDRRQAIWEHAKLNGADFRAVGNEPGWSMEIRNQSRIILTTAYGSEHYEFDLPEAETDAMARTTRYEVAEDGHVMTLIISGEACHDSMSGEAFESKVEILFKGRLLRGCGRALH